MKFYFAVNFYIIFLTICQVKECFSQAIEENKTTNGSPKYGNNETWCLLNIIFPFLEGELSDAKKNWSDALSSTINQSIFNNSSWKEKPLSLYPGNYVYPTVLRVFIFQVKIQNGRIIKIDTINSSIGSSLRLDTLTLQINSTSNKVAFAEFLKDANASNNLNNVDQSPKFSRKCEKISILQIIKELDCYVRENSSTILAIELSKGKIEVHTDILGRAFLFIEFISNFSENSIEETIVIHEKMLLNIVVQLPITILDIPFMILMFTLFMSFQVMMGSEMDLKIIWKTIKKPYGLIIGFLSQYLIMPSVFI